MILLHCTRLFINEIRNIQSSLSETDIKREYEDNEIYVSASSY